MAEHWKSDYPDQKGWFDALSKDFARNARQRRLTMRLSQKLVAHMMWLRFGPGWHQTIVAKIENEQRAVRMDEAIALSHIYGIELADLVAGKNLDEIRDGYTTADEGEGVVYVESRWNGDRDVPLVPIADLLDRAERSLKSETTREMMNLGRRLKREFPDDEAARVKAWQAARRASRGEHPEA